MTSIPHLKLFSGEIHDMHSSSSSSSSLSIPIALQRWVLGAFPKINSISSQSHMHSSPDIIHVIKS
jgi:hypothetical protein